MEGTRFQSAAEIEAQNRAIVQNPAGVSVPAPAGTVAAVAEAMEEDAEKAERDAAKLQVDAEAAAAKAQETRALADEAKQRLAEMPPSDAEKPADEPTKVVEPPPDYEEMTVEQLRQHAAAIDVSLSGLTTKAEIIAEIKKHDRRVAREAARA